MRPRNAAGTLDLRIEMILRHRMGATVAPTHGAVPIDDLPPCVLDAVEDSVAYSLYQGHKYDEYNAGVPPSSGSPHHGGEKLAMPATELKAHAAPFQHPAVLFDTPVAYPPYHAWTRMTAGFPPQLAVQQHPAVAGVSACPPTSAAFITRGAPAASPVAVVARSPTALVTPPAPGMGELAAAAACCGPSSPASRVVCAPSGGSCGSHPTSAHHHAPATDTESPSQHRGFPVGAGVKMGSDPDSPVVHAIYYPSVAFVAKGLVQPAPVGPGPYPCTFPGCKAVFKRRYDHSIHQRVHTNVRPFFCPLCNATFKTCGACTAHIRTHTGERPYKCPHPGCHAEFSQRSSCNRHFALRHGPLAKGKRPTSAKTKRSAKRRRPME